MNHNLPQEIGLLPVGSPDRLKMLEEYWQRISLADLQTCLQAYTATVQGLSSHAAELEAHNCLMVHTRRVILGQYAETEVNGNETWQELRDKLSSRIQLLRTTLANLLGQAEDRERFSSWLGMCGYLSKPDARDTARILLETIHTHEATSQGPNQAAT